MLNTIIKGILARLEQLEIAISSHRIEVLEEEIKVIKWIANESLKVAEQNELAIDSISRLLNKDPAVMRKPVNKGGRPKLAIKRVK